MKKYFILLLSLVLLYSCNKDNSSEELVNSKRLVSVSSYEHNKLGSKDYYTYTDDLISQIDRVEGIGMSNERSYRYSFNYSSSGIEVEFFKVEDESLELLDKVSYHYNQSLLVRKDFYSLVDLDNVYRSINYKYQNNLLTEFEEINLNSGGTPFSKRKEFEYNGEKLIKQSEFHSGENYEHAGEYIVYEYLNDEIKENRYFDLKTEEMSREVHSFQNGYIVQSDLYYKNGTESIYHLGEINFQYDADGYLVERRDNYNNHDLVYFIQYETKPSNINLFRDPQEEFKYNKIPILPVDFYGGIWGGWTK